MSKMAVLLIGFLIDISEWCYREVARCFVLLFISKTRGGDIGDLARVLFNCNGQHIYFV